MKRTLKYALTAVLGAALVLPAAAQSNFPDVPENHWAYKELARMKAEGLLVGYPDGLFRGGRPASRYEMAVALHALWMKLKGMHDGLKSQIDELLAKIETKADKADVDNLRAAVEALQAGLGKFKPEDIAAMRRMIDEFGAELKALGADVKEMKAKLADLDDRVSDLEKALPISISGDANLLILAGYSDGRPGLTVDGRPTGVGRPGYPALVGADKDLTVLHEAAISFKNRKAGPVGFFGTIVYGNMLSSLGTQAATPGTAYVEGASEVYVQNFGVDFSGSLLGVGVKAKLGRVGYKIAPYIFQRPDTTPYYANSRWDNGEWGLDGGIVRFDFGGFGLKVVGGRVNTQVSSGGAGASALQPLFAGAGGIGFVPGAGRPVGFNGNGIAINQFLGVDGKYNVGGGKLGLAYLWLTGANQVINGQAANGVDVFGGTFDINFGNIALGLGYSESNVKRNNKNVISSDNAAWYANLGYDGGNWGLDVGYRQVLPQFGAPGDWGRIGVWYNPTDIEGFKVGAHLKLSDTLLLHGSGEFLTGTGERVGGVRGLKTSDKITSLKVGLDWDFASNTQLQLGWENVEWDLKGVAGGKPRENWLNIGTKWNMTDKAALSFLWQISDYNGKSTPGFAGRATGGLLSTQLSLKF
jgi:hypothetical protein